MHVSAGHCVAVARLRRASTNGPQPARGHPAKPRKLSARGDPVALQASRGSRSVRVRVERPDFKRLCSLLGSGLLTTTNPMFEQSSPVTLRSPASGESQSSDGSLSVLRCLGRLTGSAAFSCVVE